MGKTVERSGTQKFLRRATEVGIEAMPGIWGIWNLVRKGGGGGELGRKTFPKSKVTQGGLKDITSKRGGKARCQSVNK